MPAPASVGHGRATLSAAAQAAWQPAAPVRPPITWPPARLMHVPPTQCMTEGRGDDWAEVALPCASSSRTRATLVAAFPAAGACSAIEPHVLQATHRLPFACKHKVWLPATLARPRSVSLAGRDGLEKYSVSDVALGFLQAGVTAGAAQVKGFLVEPGFTSTGFGNALFLYATARLVAAALHRRFMVTAWHRQLVGLGLADDVQYDQAWAMAQSAGAALPCTEHSLAVVPALHSAAKPEYIPALALQHWIALQRYAGAMWTQTTPSSRAAVPFLQRAPALVARWLAPVTAKCVAAAQASCPSLIERDAWVVHVRVCDVWYDHSAPKSINTAYAHPPGWWHAHLARHVAPPSRAVWIVTGDARASLTAAVAAAWQAAGHSVQIMSTSVEADFGQLLRAGTQVLSVSTFAIWGALLAPFAQLSGETKPVHVHVPGTGMMHPDTAHAPMVDLALHSMPAGTWLPPKQFKAVPHSGMVVHRWPLPRLDHWQCSASQREAVLSSSPPAGWSAEATVAPELPL